MAVTKTNLRNRTQIGPYVHVIDYKPISSNCVTVWIGTVKIYKGNDSGQAFDLARAIAGQLTRLRERRKNQAVHKHPENGNANTPCGQSADNVKTNLGRHGFAGVTCKNCKTKKRKPSAPYQTLRQQKGLPALGRPKGYKVPAAVSLICDSCGIFTDDPIFIGGKCSDEFCPGSYIHWNGKTKRPPVSTQ